MSFGVDYSKASSSLLPEGEYECIIDQVRQTVTKLGTPFIDVPLIIRNDVENPRKGGKIFHSLWMKKEPNAADQACDGYSAWQIQSLSKAAGLPNGKGYASIDEWCDDLYGKLVRVTVEHSAYKGKENARVKWTNETKYPDCKHVAKQGSPEASPTGFTEVAEEDVPF